jgi:DNA processing protein
MTLLEPLFERRSEPASQANAETAQFCVAPLQSGALITANFALEHGREVFAVPNGIYAMGSVGVNKLIQDGAHLVTDVQDILMSLNLFMIPEHIEMQVALPDNEEEGALLPLLSHDPLHIDEIIRIAELPTMTVASTLQKA